MAANEIRYDNMCIANYFAFLANEWTNEQATSNRVKEDILSAHIAYRL